MEHCHVQTLALAMAASLLATTGCQGMAATPENAGASRSSRPDNTVTDWPLKFAQHNFGTICFSTYGCIVDYTGYRHIAEPDEALQLPFSQAHPDTLRNLPAGYVGVRVLAASCRAITLEDGSGHEARVDIGAIFADGLIRHEVPREDVPVGVSIGAPDVLLVVDDRAVTVYMRAFVPPMSLRTPGNRNSNFRRDPVRVWSRT